jgi:hypothetical protein
MKQKIIITSTEFKNRAISIIEALPLDVIHDVTIREHKKDRSAEQNALYWQWLTVIGGTLGESKEDIHERYKDKFLVNIYERDDSDYAEMVQALREVWKHGMKVEAVNLRRRIVALTSTTTANVKQMTEYMENIEHDAASLAISLPHPEA